MQRPCDPRTAAPGPYDYPEPNFWSVLQFNGLGKFIERIGYSYVPYESRQLCSADFQVQATKTALAIKQYEAKNGALPGSLTALVPGYMASLPADSFGGGTLGYDKSARLLVSAGKGSPAATGLQSPYDRLSMGF